jgi:putative transposase
VKTVCAKHNISEPTYYAWKKKYGGMDVSEARRQNKRSVLWMSSDQS